MKQSKYVLEQHRFFPIIAWLTIIGFSLYVYFLVQDLQKSTTELHNIASRLEHYAKTPPLEIEDFSR